MALRRSKIHAQTWTVGNTHLEVEMNESQRGVAANNRNRTTETPRHSESSQIRFSPCLRASVVNMLCRLRKFGWFAMRMVGSAHPTILAMNRWMTVVVFALALTVVARAEAPVQTVFDPARHMRVAEVKNGMTGYGLSVFQGTKIERFEVEVVSVLRNFNPKYDVVLIRCKGANLEHTGGVAGMSGSPVYLRDDKGKDRMIGAFAYGWQAAKDPLAGVQPIEYMLAMPQPAAGKEPAGEPRAIGKKRALWTVGESFAAPWNSTHRTLNAHGAPAATQAGFGAADLRPLATPVMSSGLPQTVIDKFAPLLREYGMMPVQAGGAGADASGRYGAPAKLEPGSAIAVPIVTGDMDLTAIGTVTEVIDGRVFAFGHSFFSEGEVSLPMGSAYIHSVIPSLISSFKLGSATGVQGTLQNDQIVGIAGKLGASPATIPVQIRCLYEDGTSDLTYRFNVAKHPKLTPMAAGMATLPPSDPTATCRNSTRWTTISCWSSVRSNRFM